MVRHAPCAQQIDEICLIEQDLIAPVSGQERSRS